MRGAIWILLIFAVAVVAATTLGSNDDLVAVYFRGWRIDLSLNLFLLVVVGTCFALMTAYRAIETIVTLPQRARDWRALQRERAAQRALREAAGEYFGARYSRAQRAAQRAMTIQDDSPALRDDGEFRVLAQLLAAGSAHRLQDRKRRDELMRQMLDAASSGSARAAADGARLMSAEWALEDRDAEQARQLLATLPPGVARRTQALKLRLQAARMARQPLEALRVTRMLAKHQAFSPAAALGLVRALAAEALETTRDADQLRRVWHELDHAERLDPAIVARAARRAAALGAADDARSWLRPLWDRIGELAPEDRALVSSALGDVAAGVGVDWLQRAEAAFEALPTDAAVAAAAGIVFAERGLWGKARRPLEQAASQATLDPRLRRRAWRLLARLAREEGDEQRAAQCEHAAAEIG